MEWSVVWVEAVSRIEKREVELERWRWIGCLGSVET